MIAYTRLRKKLCFLDKPKEDFFAKKGSSFSKVNSFFPCNFALKNRFLEGYHSSHLGGRSGLERTHNCLAAKL